jgi:hypothetical protein
MRGMEWQTLDTAYGRLTSTNTGLTWVPPAGIEPATPDLGGRSSIH